jgi:hypothetical protein
MNPNATVGEPPKAGDRPDTPDMLDAPDAPDAPDVPNTEADGTAAADTAADATGDVATAEPTDLPAAPANPPAATPVPEPRATADPDPDVERGKSKKQRKAVRGRSAGGTKSLVVWHQGRVHYADDSVFVLDLDDAACAELDVHDLVDRLTELREVLDSPGRSEAVSALVEIIQEKALN